MPDLDMSPYAAFVWSAWGISALILAALVIRALLQARRWKRELSRLELVADEATRPQAARSAVGPKVDPQAARSAVGQEQ